jgi:hypothetical protein
MDDSTDSSLNPSIIRNQLYDNVILNKINNNLSTQLNPLNDNIIQRRYTSNDATPLEMKGGKNKKRRKSKRRKSKRRKY